MSRRLRGKVKLLTDRSNTRLFQVLFLKNDRHQSVYIDEVEEVDLTEIKKHLGRGESVFITRREEQKLETSRKELDMTKDLMSYLLAKGEPVRAYVTDSFWRDAGSVERCEKLENGFVEKSFGFPDGMAKPLSAEAQVHKGLRTGEGRWQIWVS